MKRTTLFFTALFSLAAVTHAQVIFSDNFNTTSTGTGFVLGEGVNSGINPPTTRLEGTVAGDLRYIPRGPDGRKADDQFLIGGNARLRVNNGAGNGRTTLSSDGINPFDFGVALGVGAATPSNPVVYDIKISMDNNASGTHRMSLGFGTIEGNANEWDFGLQLHKAAAGNNFYTVSKRMNTDSIGIGSRNDPMLTLGANSAGTEVSFVIRVTDAGAETDSFNSRIQVSIDDGNSWFYDSNEDSVLVNGFRFDGAGRYLSLDVAGGNSSFVTYDGLSITIVPEPSTIALAGIGGAALLFLGRRAKNSRK